MTRLLLASIRRFTKQNSTCDLSGSFSSLGLTVDTHTVVPNGSLRFWILGLPTLGRVDHGSPFCPFRLERVNQRKGRLFSGQILLVQNVNVSDPSILSVSDRFDHLWGHLRRRKVEFIPISAQSLSN